MATTKAVLSKDELQALLAEHPAWSVQDGKLVRHWAFADFVQAMEFVNRVATLAEAAQHHPDIDIRYNKVQLGLISHDAGGITARDARMAAQISKEFPA